MELVIDVVSSITTYLQHIWAIIRSSTNGFHLMYFSAVQLMWVIFFSNILIWNIPKSTFTDGMYISVRSVLDHENGNVIFWIKFWPLPVPDIKMSGAVSDGNIIMQFVMKIIWKLHFLYNHLYSCFALYTIMLLGLIIVRLHCVMVFWVFIVILVPY